MRSRIASVVGWEGWSPDLIFSSVDLARPVPFALTTARSFLPRTQTFLRKKLNRNKIVATEMIAGPSERLRVTEPIVRWE